MTARLTALDLFAGTGWGVACRELGIEEWGVELMPEARATREANGMRNLFADVWDGIEGAHPIPPHSILIASPPCQSFSMAGKGAGRQALDAVLGLIDSKAYLEPHKLRAFGEAHDPRTALVLTPLTYVAQHAPTYVVLEQVPPVLPVWERMATELREWGYSVVTGVLNAEQYGVPQTRRRAILIARADGVEAKMPTPTHSRYYSRDRKRLDPDVLPWVSMAEALEWGMTERPYMSVASGTEAGGGTEGCGVGGSGARRTVHAERNAGRWLKSNYTSNGEHAVEREGSKTKRGVRHDVEPASTLTSKAGSMHWRGAEDGYAYTGDTGEVHDVVMLRRDEKRGVALVKIEASPSLPMGAEVTVPLRKIGPRPPRFAGAGAAAERTAGQVPREGYEPAHTLTGKGTAAWIHDRPSTTVVGTHNPDIIAAPGGSGVRPTDVSRHRQDRPGSVRVTIEEAAALQSYPPGFDWHTGPNGKPLTKTKAFLQVGNAVPPLLAKAILETLLD